MKLSASFFRRMTLGMSLVGTILMAIEDNKISKEEMVMMLNQLFQGLGAEVDFKGLIVQGNEDGSVSLTIPAEVMKKLEFKL
jgi:hypothetical protein